MWVARVVGVAGASFVVASCSSPAQRPQPAESATAASASTTPTNAPSTRAAASAPPPSEGLLDTPLPDATREERIRQRFGERCRLERACGALWGIDCDAAVDGPYYYVKSGSLEVVSRCGGYCMGGRCTNCPPKEWRCPTY